MNNEPLSLRERQLEYLRILKELDRYCTENGLRYYIGCGTLIGAVRHKGFIPWDDDLDVFMPRPDYMKMVMFYKSQDFSFHTIYNDKSHPFPFGRLCSHNLFSLCNNIRLFNFGIDVYVINGAPASKEKQQKLMDDAFVHLKRKNKLQNLRSSLVKRRLWPSRNLNFALLNRELFKAERVFERYDFEKSDYIWPFGGGRLIMKKENYGTPARIQFEDSCFYAPEHYKDVLTLAYGDYMQLPPEDQRVPYHGGDYYWK